MERKFYKITTPFRPMNASEILNKSNNNKWLL